MSSNQTSTPPAGQEPDQDDTFELYDLRVEVVGCRPGRRMVCNHPIGSYFDASGENLKLPPGQSFPVYPLASLLIFLPAKQWMTHSNDWMTTDVDIACPDPNCGGIFRIQRMGTRVFHHSDVTAVPLGKGDS